MVWKDLECLRTWLLMQWGGFKELSVKSEQIVNNRATVTFNVIRKSGAKDTQIIKLRKDADGLWGIYLDFK